MCSVVIKSTPFDENVAKRSEQNSLPPRVKEKEPAGARRGEDVGGEERRQLSANSPLRVKIIVFTIGYKFQTQ